MGARRRRAAECGGPFRLLDSGKIRRPARRISGVLPFRQGRRFHPILRDKSLKCEAESARGDRFRNHNHLCHHRVAGKTAGREIRDIPLQSAVTIGEYP